MGRQDVLLFPRRHQPLPHHGVPAWRYRIAGKFGGGIKFGGLAIYITTAKLKSAKIFYLHIIIYVW